MITIKYVDGLCGTGKTFHAVKYIKRSWTDDPQKRICVVQPSKLLLQQTENDLIKEGVPVKRIDGDVTSKAISTIIAYLQMERVDVLLITHQAFFSIGFWAKASDWEIIFDEVPNISQFYKKNTKGGSRWLCDLFRPNTNENFPDYYFLSCVSESVVDELRKQTNDETNKYYDVAADADSGHIEVMCLKSQWDNVIDKKADQITFYSFIKPSVFADFRSVTIMSANFLDSMVYSFWSQMNVKFVPNQDISTNANYHVLGVRTLNIYYISVGDYSKALMAKTGLDVSMISIKEAIDSVFKGNNFIWAANNSIDDEYMLVKNGVRISNVSHGLNQYIGVHNVLVMSALNLTPDHSKAISSIYSIDPNKQKEGISHASIYQTAMRCSLRNDKGMSDVNVIVPDKKFGEWFAKLFSGKVVIQQLDSGITELGSIRKTGRPKISAPLTPAERKKRQRERQRALLGKTTPKKQQ